MESLLTKRTITIGSILIVLIIVVSIGMAFIKNQPVKVETPAPVETLKIEHSVIGKSVEGRDIEAYRYGKGSTTVLFVGGIHGGYEWNSVVLAYNLMDYIQKNPKFVPDNLTIAVIPNANPDGVFAVIGKEGKFSAADVPVGKEAVATARFNAHKVDLNRNFDCNWQAKSMWQSKTVSAGIKAFSEPEAVAIRDFVLAHNPEAVVFWHSAANAVYASECNDGILPVTLDVMDAYAKAAGYAAVKSFDSYKVTGDAEGWLASIKIPAITVEMKSHDTVEWDKNIAGIKAVVDYFAKK